MSHKNNPPHRPLNVTQQAKHRIFVGLGWDPNERPGALDSIGALLGFRKTAHDLDLACFIYDTDANYIDAISHGASKAIHIYHSGDSQEGIGEGDDEQISVELKDLDPHIHHIVFTASIKSGHVFADIASPEIRIGDGYSNHVFLRSALDAKEGHDHSTYVFARIYRTGESWALHEINEYHRRSDIQNWPDFLKRYLV